MKDASELTGVKTPTIRQWEKDRLLKLPRDQNGARFLTSFELERVKAIKELRDKDVPIKLIKSLMDESVEDGKGSESSEKDVITNATNELTEGINLPRTQEEFMLSIKNVIESSVQKQSDMAFQEAMKQIPGVIANVVGEKVAAAVEITTEKVTESLHKHYQNEIKQLEDKHAKEVETVSEALQKQQEQSRSDNLNLFLTERRVKMRLEKKAGEEWLKLPAEKRLEAVKTGIFKTETRENIDKKQQFIKSYVNERFEDEFIKEFPSSEQK